MNDIDPIALIFGGVLTVAIFAIGVSMLPKRERNPVTTSQSQLRWLRAIGISWFVILALFGSMYIQNKVTSDRAIREANRKPNAECTALGYSDVLCLEKSWRQQTGR